MNQTDTTIIQMSLLNEARSSTLIAASNTKVPMCSLSTQVLSIVLGAQVAQVPKCLKCPASPQVPSSVLSDKLPQALNCLKRLPPLQNFLLP